MNKLKSELLGSCRFYTRTQIISINALLCAIILLFVLVPISIGPFSLAVIPIIAVLISAETMGLLNGILTGLFFGFVSFINQFIHPGIFAQMLIENPLVTFFPRIMIGVIVYLVIKVFDLIKTKIKTNNKAILTTYDVIKYVFASIFGVATNTAGFLGFLYLFYHGATLKGGAILDGPFIWAIVLSNSLIELGVCGALTPALVMAVKKTLELSMRKKTKKQTTVIANTSDNNTTTSELQNNINNEQIDDNIKDNKD
ncbi:MAG: ECF transporter S component [Clostridia bacterium]|nr:ECF transporter S component [Clostridia bacterium]